MTTQPSRDPATCCCLVKLRARIDSQTQQDMPHEMRLADGSVIRSRDRRTLIDLINRERLVVVKAVEFMEIKASYRHSECNLEALTAPPTGQNSSDTQQWVDFARAQAQLRRGCGDSESWAWWTGFTALNTGRCHQLVWLLRELVRMKGELEHDDAQRVDWLGAVRMAMGDSDEMDRGEVIQRIRRIVLDDADDGSPDGRET